MATADVNRPAEDGPSKEEAERRMMELQMMDLGTQRREYISTVDNPSRYRNVTKDQIEANRRVRADPKVRRLAEENQTKLSAWNSVHETIGDDVEIEDLDSLMDGQSHRARLYDVVREHGGQSYVEPEPLYNGHSHRPTSSHSHGSGKQMSNDFFKKKKGEAAITNAAGRTRKALPNLGKHTVELPSGPRSANPPPPPPPPPKPLGKKKSKPLVISQLDPAKNPSLIPGQLPQKIPTQPRAMGPPSVASSADTKDSSKLANKFGPVKKPSARPPRTPVGPSIYSKYMADPNDFMKAVEAAMPPEKPLRNPMSPTLPIGSPVNPPSVISAPSVASAKSVRNFTAVEDDPNAFMMKAASIVGRPRESSAQSVTSEVTSQQSAPRPAEKPTIAYVGSLRVTVASRPSSPHQEKTKIEPAKDAVEDGEVPEQLRDVVIGRRSPDSGSKIISVETLPPPDAHPEQNDESPREPCVQSQSEDMPKTQDEAEPISTAAPSGNLLDLDFDEAPVDPPSKPIRPSISLNMLPFTEPNPPKTPVPQTPRSSSPTPKNRRALEAYLRVFVRFRVELRKLRQLSKKVTGDEELKQYINQRKQEVEDDYNVLWEELTERYPDIDMDEIEEEVLIRSLKVPIRISETDLDQLRKKQKEAKQQTEPLDPIQTNTCAHEEETASVAPTTTSTSRIPLATSTNTAEPPTVTQKSSSNEATPKSRTVNAEAPIFSPKSSHSQRSIPSSYTGTILGEENLPGRSRSRSSTTASVTPSMASNIFHPGRTTGGVSGLQSEASTFDGYTGQFFNPTTPLPQAPNPFASGENTFPVEQPVFTETPGGLFKPVYPNVQSGVYSPAPQYAFQGKTYPWPANRYTSMPAVFSGHNTFQQQYQGYSSALNTSMPNLTQSPQPAQALQQSKWAAAPAANTPRNKTPAAQLETFTAKLQNRGITLKPSPGNSTGIKTADNDTAEVSHLTTKMKNLNGLGNGKPNLDPKVSTVKSDENVKEGPKFSFSFPKPAPKTKLVGLTGSKWAV